ncbi:MAG: hypothetical protein AAF195_03565, partial [Pseudomonadota bacterium]
GIILTIIITGGYIIDGARRDGLIADIKKYQVAYKTFYIKYRALPGDISNGSDYFSSEIGCSNADVNSDNTGCNGNGDLLIGRNTITAPENLRAHHHLSASDIIVTNTTASINTTVNETTINFNTPGSKYNDITTFFFASDNISANYLSLNSLLVVQPNNNNFLPIVRVEDAALIDEKLDDGQPYQGSIISYNANDDDCVEDSLVGAVLSDIVKQNSTYLFTSDTECIMRIAFEGKFN